MKNNIVNFFVHFFRRLLFFLTIIITSLVCNIIFVFTYEPKKWRKVTMRKIRRIRRLTKLKLWLWKNFRWYFEFIHKEEYLKDLERRMVRK